MTQPDAKAKGSWRDRVRARLPGGRRPDSEVRAERRGKLHPERIADLQGRDKHDKHDPMSGVGGSW